MYIPSWFILTLILIGFGLTNEKIRAAMGWALIGVFVTANSPFILCYFITDKVFGWDKEDWKTGVFTLFGGFGLYYLIVPVIVSLFN